MVGTCKECGAVTRGRYTLCPDCRAEGRSPRAIRNNNSDVARMLLLVFPFVMFYIGYYVISTEGEWISGIIFILMGLFAGYHLVKMLMFHPSDRRSISNTFDRWGSRRF